MILKITKECGETCFKNIKDFSDVKIQEYKDACLLSTTKNKKGDYVRIVNIEFITSGNEL